jgi:BirA family biotin operon repressor/biotin-[acetyl-CoA-carboxylase] ligase
MIQFIPETGSTSADIVARLGRGDLLPEGFWLVSDRQNAGRGRQGRPWEDATGNFMGSTLVRLGPGDPPSSTLSFAVGLALYETCITRLVVPRQLQLKWPNDLLLMGAKLSGILLEQERDVVVIGIGVNLAEAPFVLGRATVSFAEFGPAPDRDQFAHDLSNSLAQELDFWRANGAAQVVRRWQAVAHPVGTQLTVHEPGGSRVSGIYDGLQEDGALRLRMVDGALRLIHAGEVLLEEKQA